MSQTRILKAQHDAAIAIAQRLLVLIDSYRGSEDAYAIMLQLTKLFGLLRIHLAQEDTQLYPRLANCSDAAVAELARVYIEEMRSLAQAVERFALRWSSSAVIAGAFEHFREGAFALIATIEVRIERENVFLYPLVDALAAKDRRAA